jgi:cysteinyl-tRNA synthetase
LWEFVKSAEAPADKLEFLKYADNFLSLSLLEEEEKKALPREAKDLIAKRQEARKNKDFKTSDELRAALDKMGVAVKDTPEGTEWRWK